MSAKLAFVFFSMILMNNFVLVKLLGICPFLNFSGNLRSSVRLSAVITFVMVAASAITWPLYHFILAPLGIQYLENLLFILIIVVLVQLTEMVLRRYLPPLHRKLGDYLPLITANCAVLGVTLLNMSTPSLINPAYPYFTYLEALLCAAGAGVGFALAMMLFSGVHRRLVLAQPPKPFEGLPITLVAAGIVSLSFMGFGGLQETLLGV